MVDYLLGGKAESALDRFEMHQWWAQIYRDGRCSHECGTKITILVVVRRRPRWHVALVSAVHAPRSGAMIVFLDRVHIPDGSAELKQQSQEDRQYQERIASHAGAPTLQLSHRPWSTMSWERTSKPFGASLSTPRGQPSTQ